VTARRVLTIGGTAAIGTLALLVPAAPAAALPSLPPAVPVSPVAPPAIVTGAVDGVVAAVDEVADPASPAPAVAEPNVAVVAEPAGTASTNALEVPATASPPPKAPPRPSFDPQPGAAPTPLAEAGLGRAEHRAHAGGPAPDGAPAPPTIGAEVVNAPPVGVTGTLDLRSHSSLGSTIGTAAASVASWGALCMLALAVRLVAISAWRDAQRRRRLLNPR
jgi:hypothetical protein